MAPPKGFVTGKGVLRFAAMLAMLMAAGTALGQVAKEPAAAREVKLDLYEPPNPTLVRPSEDPKRTVNGGPD